MTAPQQDLFPTDSSYETAARELSVEGLWERVFTVAPLVIVGSKDTDGTYDLAPKHMAMPLGWGDRYCFVCTPRHRTYRNIERHGVFTVSYPHSFQVVQASLAASAPRAGRYEAGVGGPTDLLCPRGRRRARPRVLPVPRVRSRTVRGRR